MTRPHTGFYTLNHHNGYQRRNIHYLDRVGSLFFDAPIDIDNKLRSCVTSIFTDVMEFRVSDVPVGDLMIDEQGEMFALSPSDPFLLSVTYYYPSTRLDSMTSAESYKYSHDFVIISEEVCNRLADLVKSNRYLRHPQELDADIRKLVENNMSTWVRSGGLIVETNLGNSDPRLYENGEDV